MRCPSSGSCFVRVTGVGHAVAHAGMGEDVPGVPGVVADLGEELLDEGPQGMGQLDRALNSLRQDLFPTEADPTGNTA